MELTNQQMIRWLNYDDVRVRTAAFEQLTEGFECSEEMLQAIFALGSLRRRRCDPGIPHGDAPPNTGIDDR